MGRIIAVKPFASNTENDNGRASLTQTRIAFGILSTAPWESGQSPNELEVLDRATAEVIGKVPLGTATEVDRAARAARVAFNDWRRVPVTERIQYLR
jgi:delta 1-pyrroline-5-carboxylate dehydrogenase